MPLDISIKETKPTAFLVTLTGELDSNTYEKVEKETEPVLKSATAIIFDLTGLDYVSSMGLRTFSRVRTSMEEKGGSFMLVNPQPQVKLVFDAVQFLSDSLLASLEQADELLDNYLDKVQKGKVKPYQPPAK